MKNIENMTKTEIKAELWTLQYHNCNGRLTIRQDGTRDHNDKSCDGCSRISVLHGQLRQLYKDKHDKSSA